MGLTTYLKEKCFHSKKTSPPPVKEISPEKKLLSLSSQAINYLILRNLIRPNVMELNYTGQRIVAPFISNKTENGELERILNTATNRPEFSEQDYLVGFLSAYQKEQFTSLLFYQQFNKSIKEICQERKLDGLSLVTLLAVGVIDQARKRGLLKYDLVKEPGIVEYYEKTYPKSTQLELLFA